MASIKPPKKSETIEIRLSHEAKAAFMERCRQERRTASEAIRLLIDNQRVGPDDDVALLGEVERNDRNLLDLGVPRTWLAPQALGTMRRTR